MCLGIQEELVQNSLKGVSRDVPRWLCSQGSHSTIMDRLLSARWHTGAGRCYRIHTASALQPFLMGSKRLGVKCSGQRWGRWALKAELAVTQQTGWSVALTTWSQYRPHRFTRPLSLHTSATGSGGLQAIHTSGQQAINPGVPATPSQNSGKHYTYKYSSIIKDANQNQPNQGHMGRPGRVLNSGPL